MDHIAHLEGLDGRTFHLVDPHPKTVVDAIDVFARAAGAPRFRVRIGEPLGAPGSRRSSAGRSAARPSGSPARRSTPGSGSRLAWSRTSTGRRASTAGRRGARSPGAGSRCPPLESYAQVLWGYWENELDADLRFSPALARRRAGPPGADHRRVGGHRSRRGAEARRGGRPGAAGGPLARSGSSASGAGSSGRAARPTCTRATSRASRAATSWPSACSTSRAASTCS